MTPLDVQDEILILLLGPHDTDRLASADQHAVTHIPRVFGGIHIHPTGKVFAVEEILELGDAFGAQAGCKQN